jgi:hypothetical protein
LRNLQELPAGYLNSDPSADSLASAALVRQAMRLVQGELEFDRCRIHAFGS